MLIGYVAGRGGFIDLHHSQKVRRASFRPTETLHRSRGSASALTPASRGWEQSHRDRSVGDDVAVRLDWRLLLSLRSRQRSRRGQWSLECLPSAERPLSLMGLEEIAGTPAWRSGPGTGIRVRLRSVSARLFGSAMRSRRCSVPERPVVIAVADEGRACDGAELVPHVMPFAGVELGSMSSRERGVQLSSGKRSASARSAG